MGKMLQSTHKVGKYFSQCFQIRECRPKDMEVFPTSRSRGMVVQDLPCDLWLRIDLVASQLVLESIDHHLVFYGPLGDDVAVNSVGSPGLRAAMSLSLIEFVWLV